MHAVAGRVVTPEGVVRGRVVLDGSIIAGVVPDATAPDRWVCPGFLDLQINGSHGIDVGADPHRIGELAARLPHEGTTGFLPTVITGRSAARDAVIDTARAHRDRVGSAAVLGVHLEGPVLAPGARGAHPAEHLLAPAGCDSSRWSPAYGVRVVTVAPELPGALELIAQLAGAGVVVSLGHSTATAAEFLAGFDAGATMCTHLFNAMRPFHHRDPGPVGAVLANADQAIAAGLICDGHHVDPVAVAVAWRALGPHRVVLVTDAVAQRGGTDVPPRTVHGALAGSVVTLDASLRNLVAWTGASVPEAVATVTANPARVLGLTDRGVVEPGASADLVVLDDRLEIESVVVRGDRVR